VGQRFVSLLEGHPWFRVTSLWASKRSAGRPYREVVSWSLGEAPPASVAELPVRALGNGTGDLPRGDLPREALVFSALDASVAGALETACAEAGALVVSNAKSHRLDPYVPLVVPEINADHLELLAHQRFGGGGIVTNPNCSTIGLVLALAPLVRAFGVEAAQVVSMQALSGAGLGGPGAAEMADNLVPFIEGEEEKLASEPRKILGQRSGGEVIGADLLVSAACHRVNVEDGHTLAVSVKLGREASAEELIEAWRSFDGPPQELGLPSAPRHPVLYLDAPDAPQPRLHRGLEGGMAAVVGRLRPCPLLGWKFVTLSHNTIRGAAGGALLTAELAVAQGRLGA
jgi:aspartate-semialdehyde dehydrogenase